MSTKTIYTDDIPTDKEEILIESQQITDFAAKIDVEVSDEAVQKGAAFAQEITDRFVSDFEKTQEMVEKGLVDKADQMVHVSTFIVKDGMIYMTYYANNQVAKEDPNQQTARFVYCPIDDLDNKTFHDIQGFGEECYGKHVNMVYDTVMMQKDEDTIYIMWTAHIDDRYYRLYRPFTISTKTLGEIRVNRFKVGDVVNDFSSFGIRSALTANGIGYKKMYYDIGIMQKVTTRVENGETYYYTGTYSGDFNCIIKSKDLITWEYVAQPDFLNESKWENATYVIGDKCYYFVRQEEVKDRRKYGFLTAYDLVNKTWDKPVLIGDCQSRSDFIVYDGQLYLFHAPRGREHIGIVKVDTDNIANSSVVLQARMHTLCFYPFIQYNEDGELSMSYTIDRKHIRLAKFTLRNYL